jgi:hypothetical protein
MGQPKSAAQSLYPHLPSAEREPSTQRERSLANALWPSLSREAKQREAAQARWDEWRKRDRDSTLRLLKQINADLRRERGR